MARKWKIPAAIALGIGVSATLIAASTSSGPTIKSAADIVPSLAHAQLVSDKLPEAAAKAFRGTGIDPANTRYLGNNENLQYFSVPQGSDKICVITVGADGRGLGMSCTYVEGFEAYGLSVANPDKTNEAWLVATAGMKKALSSSTSNGQWVQKTPNFLVKSSAATK
jgi:hypothetical protein